MIVLNSYQERVLDSLRGFFRRCSEGSDPGSAFQAIQLANGSPTLSPYVPVNAVGLSPGMPYVCLRVPTGGGKTLLSCYAAGVAIHELVHADRAVVLWLVPSNTILDQTADALRDRRHAYRVALELACGSVEVFKIDEALRLSHATVEGQTVVIVATIQSFRVEEIAGRKVYDQNGALSEHFLNLPLNRSADLFKGPDGRPQSSLVNMLRLRRPVVIMDEAHNARTDLSFSTLGNVLPSCVIEFTATPAKNGTPSNVLHHVSAAELKAAEMVKLPLRVITRHPSQRDQLLAEAIALRADLERVAGAESQLTGEYLRPILLVQAERVDACEPLRDRMVNDFRLVRDEIKISVGALDELKNVGDISSPKSAIRVIITVQRLREGWDCPFAYVLCSLKETRSATAIEQIVGRVLRLPNAKAKRHPDLNCAYAFSVSDSLPEVLNELREALEANGFTAAEAQRIVIPVGQGVLPLGLQPKTERFAAGVEIDIAAAQAEVNALAGKVRLDPASGDVTVFVPLDSDETSRLVGCLKTPEAKAKLEAVVEAVRAAERAFGGSGATRVPSPYEQQLNFVVPLLAVQEGQDLFEFESTVLLEQPWKLSQKDASLPDTYNPLQRPMGKEGVVDVGVKGEVQTSVKGEGETDFVSIVHQQALQLSHSDEWSIDALIAWFDRHIDHRDIPLGESAEFLRRVLNGLIARHGIVDLNAVGLDRFRLRDQIDAVIAAHRNSERKAAFRQLLLPDSPLVVTDQLSINLRTMSYEPTWLYQGGFQFRKHYFGPKPGELRNLGEELECAQFIDGMTQIRFWVRNLVRKPSSFRLQTSSDWFYPDFLCQLIDGRVLVVEYKGKDRYTADDAAEKRAVGAVWASRSNGRCLFVMPTDGQFAVIQQLIDAKQLQ